MQYLVCKAPLLEHFLEQSAPVTNTCLLPEGNSFVVVICFAVVVVLCSQNCVEMSRPYNYLTTRDKE